MKFHVVAIFVTLMLSSMGAAAAARDDFQRGVDAFRAGEYAAAVTQFQAAERAGMHDPRLTFNLGSSYFKLGELDAARQRFDAIANDAQWGALAQYNLGLIDERQGRTSAAKSHFRTTLARTDSEKVRVLAQRKLGEPSVQRADTSSGWNGLFSIGGGFDDNVVLNEDPAILGVSDNGDAFITALAATSGYLVGSYDGGLRLDLGASGDAYQDLSQYDEANANVGLAWTKQIGGWFVDMGIKGDASALDQDLFTSGGALRLRAYHPISENTGIQLRGETRYISGADDYDYLSGDQQVLTAEFQIHHASGRVRVGYTYEVNNRDDYTTSTEFFSYSPTRNMGYLGIEQNLSKRITTELYAAYRVSDYDDEDQVVIPSGAIIVEQRKDELLSLGVRGAFNFSAWFAVFVDYRYSDNDSNFDTYQYSANRVTLGLESSF